MNTEIPPPEDQVTVPARILGRAGNPEGEAKIVVGEGHASGRIAGNQVVTRTGMQGRKRQEMLLL
jgi:hypothetical protein